MLHKAICALMAIVLAVGLMPLPKQAYAGELKAAAAVDATKVLVKQADSIIEGETYIFTAASGKDTLAMSYEDPTSNQSNLKGVKVTLADSGSSKVLDFGSVSSLNCEWTASAGGTGVYLKNCTEVAGALTYLYAVNTYSVDLSTSNNPEKEFKYNSGKVCTADEKYYLVYTSDGFGAATLSDSSVTLWHVIGADTSGSENNHAVTIDSGITGGTVEASAASAAKDDTVTLTVTPAKGKKLASLSYTPEGGSACAIDISGSTYSFPMPNAAVTVSATFEDRTEGTLYLQVGYQNGSSKAITVGDTGTGYWQLSLSSFTKTANTGDAVALVESDAANVAMQWYVKGPNDENFVAITTDGSGTATWNAEASPSATINSTGDGAGYKYTMDYSSFTEAGDYKYKCKVTWQGVGYETFEAYSDVATVTVSAASQQEKYSQSITAYDQTKSVGDGDFKFPAEATDRTSTLTFSGDNDAVATVASDGTVHIVAAGTVNITITASETNSYKPATKTVVLTVESAGNTITVAGGTWNDTESAWGVSGGTFVVTDENWTKNNLTSCKAEETVSVHSVKAAAGTNKIAEVAVTKTTGGATVLVTYDSYNKEYLFEMPDEAVTITVTFRDPYTPAISAATGIEHGGITFADAATEGSPITGTATEGSTVYVIPDPAEGYAIDTVSYTPAGGEATDVKYDNSKSGYCFTMPSVAVTVNATFVKTYSLINPDTDKGVVTCNIGSFSPYNPVVTAAKPGERVSFKIAALDGWDIETCEEDDGESGTDTYPKDFSVTWEDNGVTKEVTVGSLRNLMSNSAAYFTMPAGDVTFHVSYVSQGDYSLSIAEAEHGSVTASKSKFSAGDEINLTIEPGFTYKCSELALTDKNGTTVDPSKYTLDFTAGAKSAKLTIGSGWGSGLGDLTITPTFESDGITRYELSAANDLVGGSIAIVRDEWRLYEAGGEATFKAVPDPGYQIAYTEIENSTDRVFEVSATYIDPQANESATLTETASGLWHMSAMSPVDGSLTFTITDMPAANVTVSARFLPIDYDVNLSPSISGGSVAVDKPVAHVGDKVTLTPTPAAGNELEAISVVKTADPSVALELAESGGKYTFEMPAGHVTVKASFKKKAGGSGDSGKSGGDSKAGTTGGGAAGGEGAQKQAAQPTAGEKVAGADAGAGVKADATVNADGSSVTLTKAETTANKVTIDTVTVDGVAVPVTVVAANALKGSKAKSITVGDSVTEIGANALANTKKLTSLTIGKSVKKAGKNVLKGSKVKKVTLKSSKLNKKNFKNLFKKSKVKTIKLKGVSKKAKKNYKKWAKALKIKVK